MLNRDFSKSSLEYMNKNKFKLIGITLFLILGLIMALVFGFNGNFEMKGYNEFSVTIGTMNKEDRNDAIEDIAEVVNSYKGSYDSYSIVGEGGNTELVIRYTKNVSQENQVKINQEICEELEIQSTMITKHTKVGASVRAEDYIFCAAVILVILLAATIFAIFRYNVASAISLLATSVVATWGFMSFASILRLSLGISYFAMLVALNVLVVYFAFNIFETMRRESWLKGKDYASAIKSSMTHNRARFNFIGVAIAIVGLLFVLIGTPAIKYVSINIMFMAVSVLAASCYILPFFWNMLIGYNKVKNSSQKNK